MEWVEKAGKSLDEAKERALGELGVSESDAEVVVLAEPKTGLFGRVRGEARVRARVRPAEPRPKRQRRQRERGRGDGPGGSGGLDARSSQEARAATSTPTPAAAAARASQDRDGVAAGRTLGDGVQGQTARGGRSGSRRRRSPVGERGRPNGATAVGEGRGRDRAAPGRAAGAAGKDRDDAVREESTVADGITLQEQAEVAKEFLEGLLDRYGLQADIEVRELDTETVELAASGEGLGVLVGPKGATIAALQDVTRTVVQRRFPNRTDRILVDVAGYRQRRIAALRRFTEQVAGEVLETGAERALEPMSPADRKVVHDTVVSIDGVSSSSQGEEPHRFVVISPAG